MIDLVILVIACPPCCRRPPERRGGACLGRLRLAGWRDQVRASHKPIEQEQARNVNAMNTKGTYWCCGYVSRGSLLPRSNGPAIGSFHGRERLRSIRLTSPASSEVVPS